ncbi:uncharacterized protein BDZ99DRAFT_134771 [Mytilinidion resinicola]|uniref:Uncharacterized protein n=1 Tax=Mytilinidion resinicola TaxID=574789 RepID=A0A6A6Z5I5_9PEZI|nr:uncharacterized protein BDZ99DRAFT_134771 [Mytilinidion resinicola]KAF2816372.1 hypothetical protein BDZ99DRAFT_134771 [Mytilinidion resinicola]
MSTSPRRLQNANYRFLVYFLALPIITLYSLCLSGCVSNSAGIPNIFAVKLQERNETSLISEIRVNYFGLCASVPSKALYCLSSSGKTADSIGRERLNLPWLPN